MNEPAVAQRDLRARMADSPNQRARNTRAALVEAYGAVIAERGGRVSVSALVERANVNRTTFYAHFSSLTALAAAARLSASPRRAAGEWNALPPGAPKSRLRAAVLDVAGHTRIEVIARDAVYRTGLAASPQARGSCSCCATTSPGCFGAFCRPTAPPAPCPATSSTNMMRPSSYMCVAHAAYGGVGLLTQWLRSGVRDPGPLLQVATNALPAFWFELTAHTP